MNPSFRLAGGVRTEIREAADWYRRRDRHVAARFVVSVDRAIRRAAQWPNAGTPVEATRSTVTIRRVPVGRFPYQVVYASVDGVTYVLAVAHHHRRPGYWHSRLPN